MASNLTQKERSLLQDQLKHESICVEKYSKYGQLSRDPELRKLFNEYAQDEQEHYRTIQGFLGQPIFGHPGTGQGGSAQSGAVQWPSEPSTGADSEQSMCQDMLMTEKYMSGAYDTAVFESANPELRQALQHIQQEEQGHGEGIFRYMQSNGMYGQGQSTRFCRRRFSQMERRDSNPLMACLRFPWWMAVAGGLLAAMWAGAKMGARLRAVEEHFPCED